MTVHKFQYYSKNKIRKIILISITLMHGVSVTAVGGIEAWRNEDLGNVAKDAGDAVRMAEDEIGVSGACRGGISFDIDLVYWSQTDECVPKFR